MAVNPKKDALTSSDLAGAIPEDFVGAVNKNAAKADDELETVPFNGRDVRLQPGNKRSEDVVANRANFAAGDKLLLSPRSGYGLTDAVVEKVGKSNLQFRGWRNTVPILKLSGGLRIRGNMVSVIKGLSSNAKFAPGDVAYCRAFACNARVLSVATTKSGICNYKVALYDAKGVRTGEAVCGESDLVRKATRGVKLTTIAQGASRACDTAANILEKMLQRNKVDVPLAKKVVRLTGKDFPDARVQQAAAYLNENPPALASAARVLRAEANRLRAQGKSMKAMRAAVKRVDETTVHLVAPLHSKLLMIYRKFIGNPEATSLGNLPALAAQWKSLMAKLNPEDETGAMLVARDLMSAYRSFAKEQMKNTAYFLAMALGTANRMVGGSDRVPIPAHLRAVKADQTQVRAFHAALDELRELWMIVRQLQVSPVGGLKKDLLKGLWTKPDRAYNYLVGAGIDIPGYQAQTRKTIAMIDMIAERGSGNPKDPYGDLLFDNLYSVAIERQFVNMLNRILDSAAKLSALLSQYRRSEREWPVASMKAIDAKEYYEKNKKIPKGSILRVNGKLMEVDTPNGYVISGFEYKKPWSTSTHVSVDLRNTPAMLLSVGTGTIREGRDGNVVFGRRPARNAAKSLTKHFFGYKMYTTQVNEKDSHMAKKAIKPWARKLEPQTYITPQIWGVFKQRSPRTAALVEEAVGADGVTGRQLGNVTNDLRSFGEVDVLRKFTAQIKDWNARLTDPNYGNN